MTAKTSSLKVTNRLHSLGTTVSIDNNEESVSQYLDQIHHFQKISCENLSRKPNFGSNEKKKCAEYIQGFRDENTVYKDVRQINGKQLWRRDKKYLSLEKH